MDLWLGQGCGLQERRAVTQYREPIGDLDTNSPQIDGGQIQRWSREDDHASNGWRKYGMWIVIAIFAWLAVYGGCRLVMDVIKTF